PAASAATAPKPWVSALATSSRSACGQARRGWGTEAKPGSTGSMVASILPRPWSFCPRRPSLDGDGGRVLARGHEFDGRCAFLRQLQVHARRREVDQLAGRIERQVHGVLLAEFLKLLRIVAADPARGGDLHL